MIFELALRFFKSWSCIFMSWRCLFKSWFCCCITTLTLLMVDSHPPCYMTMSLIIQLWVACCQTQSFPTPTRMMPPPGTRVVFIVKWTALILVSCASTRMIMKGGAPWTSRFIEQCPLLFAILLIDDASELGTLTGSRCRSKSQLELNLPDDMMLPFYQVWMHNWGRMGSSSLVSNYWGITSCRFLNVMEKLSSLIVKTC